MTDLEYALNNLVLTASIVSEYYEIPAGEWEEKYPQVYVALKESEDRSLSLAELLYKAVSEYKKEKFK
jgi:hypothetical protein